MFDRRGAVLAALSAVFAGRSASASVRASGAANDRPRPVASFAAIEAAAGGRLGVSVIDTAAGRSFGWRAEERFAHCSSFKLSLAALVLQGARRGAWALDERLRWKAADLLPNSPVTGDHVADGLVMRELARAAVIASDNTATNVLLRRIGGPPAVTAFWRRLGDSESRLDRNEPELNVVLPGSESDTTTPAAMAATVARLVVGNALDPRDRALLTQWMAEVRTGTRRLRAGFPAGWICGDKTGTSLHPRSTTYVDLAYAGPAGRRPLIVAAYFVPKRPTSAIDERAEAVLADIARICAETIAG